MVKTKSFTNQSAAVDLSVAFGMSHARKLVFIALSGVHIIGNSNILGAVAPSFISTAFAFPGTYDNMNLSGLYLRSYAAGTAVVMAIDN